MQSKGLSASSKLGKPASSALVSDIGIVKKGISKKELSSIGSANIHHNSSDMKTSGVDDGISPSL
jgi:hypothetical protein